MEYKDYFSNIKKIFLREYWSIYEDYSISAWRELIRSKKLGLHIISFNNIEPIVNSFYVKYYDLYKITDIKRWMLTKLKYNL